MHGSSNVDTADDERNKGMADRVARFEFGYYCVRQ